jgi:hypothetical protein
MLYLGSVVTSLMSNSPMSCLKNYESFSKKVECTMPFVGHSMGGAIAQLLAIHHQDRLLSLASMSVIEVIPKMGHMMFDRDLQRHIASLLIVFYNMY